MGHCLQSLQVVYDVTFYDLKFHICVCNNISEFNFALTYLISTFSMFKM